MGRNIQSDGSAEDMIRAFVQLAAAEGHAKTLIEKYNSELEQGMLDGDEILNTSNKIGELTDELNELAEIRRAVMLSLFEMYDGDKEYWCMVKHLGLAAYNLFEAYQASDDDPELHLHALNANKRFVHALSHFLGTEITECVSCLGDFLKAKGET